MPAPRDPVVVAAAVAAAAQAEAQGSPVAGTTDDHGTIADVAIRRWESFARRNKVKHPTFDDRVEDLARGLLHRFEKHPDLVGPLIQDYRHLAKLIAESWRTGQE